MIKPYKQYVIYPAYTDNSRVDTYVDGTRTGCTIVPYWELSGYCKRLEQEGYTKAYDLDELLEEVVSAKEAYEAAQKAYDDAVPHRLIKGWSD